MRVNWSDREQTELRTRARTSPSESNAMRGARQYMIARAKPQTSQGTEWEERVKREEFPTINICVAAKELMGKYGQEMYRSLI